LAPVADLGFSGIGRRLKPERHKGQRVAMCGEHA